MAHSAADGDRALTDSLVDKREIVQNAMDATKFHYSALSRVITVRQEINKELMMGNGIP